MMLMIDRAMAADTFRYLKLLMDGGIYTDSDTSCVRPLSEWPGLQSPSSNAQILSDPLFTLAPYLLSLSPDKNPANPKSEEEAPSNQPSSGQADAGVLNGKMLQEAISASLDDATELPALVLAVEFDAPHTKADWKKRGYARSMQFVQVRFISIVKALNYTHIERYRDTVDDGRPTLSSR
jgi:alpha 1,6-mannosyltransferase